jgi:DNA-binding PadR family transcriptional regulator
VGTGYAIKRAVDQSTRFFWATSFAQVYPELNRLEEDNYIAGEDDPHGGRPRRTYRVTKKGARALEDWLRSQRLPGFEFRDEGLLRLFFADALSAEDALALVRRLRQQAEELDRDFREDILPLAELGPKKDYRFPYIAARLGADYYAWRANWLAQLQAELESSHTRVP